MPLNTLFRVAWRDWLLKYIRWELIRPWPIQCRISAHETAVVQCSSQQDAFTGRVFPTAKVGYND